MSINARVAELRTTLHMSQSKFGEKIGVSRDVIANIELGRVPLKDLMLNLICKTFDVNPLWLTEGEGSIFIETPQSLVDDLATEFDLSDIEKRIISNFVNLPKNEREQIIGLVKKLIT